MKAASSTLGRKDNTFAYGAIPNQPSHRNSQRTAHQPTATVGGITIKSLAGGDPQLVADQLKALPADALNVLKQKGVTFLAVPNSVVNFDPSLKGVIPRGYNGVMLNGRQQTWDNVPGMYDPTTKTVIIATSGTNSHGSWGFVLHETGHAIDAALGGLSSKAAFKAAYAPAASTFTPSEAYYTRSGNLTGYLSETFAESFAGYYQGKTGMTPVASWITGPKTSNLNTGRPSLNSYWQGFKW